MAQNETHVSNETPGMSVEKTRGISQNEAGDGRVVVCVGRVSGMEGREVTFDKVAAWWLPLHGGRGVTRADESVD